MNRVPLLMDRSNRRAWSFNQRISHLFIRESLPFWQSRAGGYVHRVRSGAVHCWDGLPTHAAFKLWCGYVGQSTKGLLLAEPNMRDVHCATCEGRAIGAGMAGSPVIAGRPVRFAPKSSAPSAKMDAAIKEET